MVRTVAKWIGITLGTLLLLGIVMSVVDPEAADQAHREAVQAETSGPAAAPAPAPPAPAEAPSVAAAAVPASADEVVERMAWRFPVPAPRDNTSLCAPACAQLITTDAVSVSEWATDAEARRWADGLDGDAAGRFALTYTGEEQSATSDEARTAWLSLVRDEFAGR